VSHLVCGSSRHDTGERVVRLADGFLNGAESASPDGAGRGHLPALDRPRLPQGAPRWYHPSPDQCGVDLPVGVGLASVLDPDHGGQDRPQAGVVVQVEWLVDAEGARLV
jgi:hypothetical protein